MRRYLLAAVLLSAAFVWLGLMIAAGPMDPLTVDPPHYTLQVENQFTRVFLEHMTPGDTMQMHQHPAPGSVLVFFTDRHNRLTYADGTSKEFRNHAGDVMWAAATAHRSENLDPINFAALQIEPRANSTTPAPAEELDPVVIDAKHYRVELENEFVRVLRVKISPHEKLALHKHPDTKAVIVYLRDGTVMTNDANGKPAPRHVNARQVRFSDARPAHQDENPGDTPMELVRVELKQAR